jgi:Zn-dependent metalloprotease
MRNIWLFFLLPFCFLPFFQSQIHAQVLTGLKASSVVPGAETIRYRQGSSIPNHIVFQSEKRISEDDFRLFAKKAYDFRAEDNFRISGLEKDHLGFEHRRYIQTWNGYPLEGSMYIVHSRNGVVVSMNGDLFPGYSGESQPQLDGTAALESALAYTGASVYKWELPEEAAFLFGYFNPGEENDARSSISQLPQGELVVAPVNGDFATGDFRLAYKFDIYAHSPLSRSWVYVDAQNGEVIWQRNRLHTADALGSANTKYSGTQPITSDSFSGGFRLRESGRGLGVETYDMNTGTTYGNAVDFTDADNFWNNFNPQYDEAGADAHWGAEMTYDYFMQKHARNSIDGNGFKLRSYVHYDQNYSNAFWDGQRMTYGDGSGNPFTSIDIAGHEITHGLTTFTADLIYSNESGALNESYSDIFGTAIEFFGKPSSADWLMGADIGFTIRSMSNPNSFNDPDTYLGTNWYTGSGDNGGVHTNSGVQNFWFYLLTTGGTGTNDLGDPYSVTGLGINQAAEVAFRCLTVYLSPSSDYADARYYSIQSAIDLYGPCTPEVISVTNAWYAVGVGDAFSPVVISQFSASPIVGCSVPYMVVFNNASTNAGSFIWDFGDGSTSTAISPTHTYTAFGTYTVSLIADAGSCGIDTVVKLAYIDIDPGNPCIVFQPQSGYVTETACEGKLFDSGGPFDNYQDNVDSYITIAPPGAASITLDFLSFDFEQDWDYLYVYDGPNSSSPLIGAYTGNTLPNGGMINSSGSSITIRQYTDVFVTASGFELDWTCNFPTAPPAADFIAVDQVSCDGMVGFQDLSTQGPISWLWDFGDGTTSTAQHPVHEYASNGIFTVTLSVQNTLGSDSETKTAYITITRPAAPSVTDGSRCDAGSVSLFASGAGLLNWYDNGGQKVFTGTHYITPSLSSTTVYSVESEILGQTHFGGPSDNAIGGGGIFGGDNRWLLMDVLEECVLVSVKVYAQGDDFRTIQYRDAFGIVIQDTNVFIPDGESRVTLNFRLQPGTDQQLATVGVTDMFRNNNGPTYPYDIMGLVEITGTNASNPTNFYYFYYDWEVRESSCRSPKVPVTATVQTGSSPTAAFSYTQSQSTLTFSDNSLNASGWSWDFGDGNSSTVQSPVHTYTSTGTFTVVQTVVNGPCTDVYSETVTVSELTTGIGELAGFGKVSLFPNPGDRPVVLIDGNAVQEIEVAVFDLSGRKVWESGIHHASVIRILPDLSGQAEGAYLFRVRAAGTQLTMKYLLRRN